VFPRSHQVFFIVSPSEHNAKGKGRIIVDEWIFSLFSYFTILFNNLFSQTFVCLHSLSAIYPKMKKSCHIWQSILSLLDFFVRSINSWQSSPATSNIFLMEALILHKIAADLLKWLTSVRRRGKLLQEIKGFQPKEVRMVLVETSIQFFIRAS